MKPTFCRLLVLVLSAVLGLAVSFCLADHSVSDSLIPPVKYVPAGESAHNLRDNNYVISVPADGVVYIGKKQVEMSQIATVLTNWLRFVPPGERVIYVKSAAAVKFETLAVLMKEAKLAGVDRIQFLLDKKKLGAVDPAR